MSRLAQPGLAFWRHAFTLDGAVTARVFSRTAVVGLVALAVTMLHQRAPGIALNATPFTMSGAVLGLLLVFRSGAGYDRWWEARALWSGISNQSLNLVVAARSYGPTDRAWQDAVSRWVAAFAHAARASLRGERRIPELAALVGVDAADEITSARHMPAFISERLAVLLHGARGGVIDDFAFQQLDQQRARLLDHYGGCERILGTPIPHVFSLMTRRFLAMYLLLLPFALVAPLGWLTPALVTFVSYPIFSLEQIGAELQDPFFRSSLSHLPLDELCASLEADLVAPPARSPRVL